MENLKAFTEIQEQEVGPHECKAASTYVQTGSEIPLPCENFHLFSNYNPCYSNSASFLHTIFKAYEQFPCFVKVRIDSIEV